MSRTTQTLTGKNALITAAGQGIGRAIAEAFIAAGADVIATDLSPHLLTELSCRTHSLDVRDRGAIDRCVGGLSRLDVLVNCAGYVHQGTILETDDEMWMQAFELNARSMFWTMQASIPRMMQAGGGAIINIASVVSSLKAAPARFAYAASKSAVIGMTRAVAMDFAAHRIRANTICPGTVDSPSLQQRISLSEAPEKARVAMVQRQPMGRLGTPAEIAQLAVYLASDAGAFATGASFVVDGGMSL